MTEISSEMRGLKRLIRKRFGGAGVDGIRYGHTSAPLDTTLWQVLAGDTVIWDAGPAVKEQIPDWDRLPEAACLLHQVVPDDEGDWLILRLR